MAPIKETPVQIKGQPFQFVIAGDRGYSFAIPTDRSTMPPKVGEAFDKLVAAHQAEQAVKTKKAGDHQAVLAANTVVRDAVHHLTDTAAATANSRRQFHEEAYSLAGSKYARAIADAQAALAQLVAHGQQHAYGLGVGIDPDPRIRSKAVATLACLSDEIANLAPVPPIDA